MVKQCKNSWIKLNPGYEIHTLDQHSLFDYIDFPKGIDIHRKDLTVQKIAVLGRLALLSKYGGAWTDATVMCVRPLDQWLEEYYTTHFFAFQNPARDRLISNWFLAAEPENLIIQRLYKSFADFYTNNYFSNQGTAFGEMLLKYFNNRWSLNFRTSTMWHSWFARKVLRVYPYFIFHYTFNKLIITDPECSKVWREAKRFPARLPHRLQHFRKVANGIEKAKLDIDSGLVPMYKLNWRIDISAPYWAVILGYLEEKI